MNFQLVWPKKKKKNNQEFADCVEPNRYLEVNKEHRVVNVWFVKDILLIKTSLFVFFFLFQDFDSVLNSSGC